MALNMQVIETVGVEHAVQFYEDDSQLLDAVAPYLLIIASRAHRRAFEAQLEAGGIDLARARTQGTYVALDAAELLAELTSAGGFDRAVFNRTVGRIVREAAQSGRAIRVYGEMVALLWDAGDVLGAIELERMWSELAHESPFAIFCAYRAASVLADEHAYALHQVCSLHTSVLQADSVAALARAERFTASELAAVFPVGPQSPGQARRLLAAAQRRWGHHEHLVEQAMLVCSELATNAVVHARSPFSLRARVDGRVLRLFVRDASSQGAPGSGRALTPKAGHGLAVIASLATSWGVEPMPGGKAVWAELSI
jgi:hypothetical protein